MGSVSKPDGELSPDDSKPEEITETKPEEMTETKTEDYRSSVIVINAAREEGVIKPKKINGMENVKDKGILSDRTVADYLTAKNPHAVDQQGLEVLLAFRRKMFALICIQCFCVVCLSAVIANIPALKDMKIFYTLDNIQRDGAIVGFTWALAMATLAGLAVFRYDYPKNYLLLAAFTVFISIALAVLAGPNVHYGVSLVFFSLTFTGIFCSIPWPGKKALEIMPITVVAMMISNVICLMFYAAAPDFIGFGWVLLTMIMNSVSITWAGYQMDRLCARLKYDEYMLPIVLLWAEILLSMLVIFALLSCSDADGFSVGSCQSDCKFYCRGYSAAYCHCDCYIYDNGDRDKDKYLNRTTRRNSQRNSQTEGTGEEGAPAQQAMDANTTIKEDVV